MKFDSPVRCVLTSPSRVSTSSPAPPCSTSGPPDSVELANLAPKMAPSPWIVSLPDPSPASSSPPQDGPTSKAPATALRRYTRCHARSRRTACRRRLDPLVALSVRSRGRVVAVRDVIAAAADQKIAAASDQRKRGLVPVLGPAIACSVSLLEAP